MFKKLLRFTRLLLRRKFSFRFPTHQDVVLVHRDGLNLLGAYIDVRHIAIADPDRPNIFVLIRMFLSRRTGLVGYLHTYISIVEPKVVITFIDNDLSFYQLQNLNGKPYYLAVQNGLRTDFSRQSNMGFTSQLDLLRPSVSLTANTICVFGDAIKDQYSKFINASFQTVGSIKNNMFTAQNAESKFDVGYISQYPPHDIKSDDGCIYFGSIPFSFASYYEAEFEVIRFLGDYCRINNLRLVVCGKRNSTFSAETDFIQSALGNNPGQIVSRDSEFSTYETLIATSIVVTVDSTVGYELLSRGHRVAFFSSRISSIENGLSPKVADNYFGFPLVLAEQGPFWSHLGGNAEFRRILDYLRAVTDEEWATEIAPYNESLMAYQPGNPVFKKLLLELGLTLIDGVKSDA